MENILEIRQSVYYPKRKNKTFNEWIDHIFNEVRKSKGY